CAQRTAQPRPRIRPPDHPHSPAVHTTEHGRTRCYPPGPGRVKRLTQFRLSACRRYGVAYSQQEEAAYAEQVRQRQERQVRRRAKELGFTLHPITPPAAAVEATPE